MASQRRTDRILFSIPILVQGQSQLGIPFSEISSTIVIGRDGARICLRNFPRDGTELKIKNLFNDLTAKFRIAHKGSARRGSITEWGVALVDPVPGFWGILFEDVPEGGEPRVSGLLVCTRCDRKVLTSLSPAEYEALGSDFVVKRLCSRCREVTDWAIGLSEEKEDDPLPSTGGQTEIAARVDKQVEASDLDRRQSPRYAIKIPLLVTASTGASETTVAEDFSKVGAKFQSSLELACGDLISVIVGHEVVESATARPARVIWRNPFEKSARYVYAVEFL